MASCITSSWVSTAPQVKLTVSLNSTASDGDTAVLDWKLEYVAHGYAANVATARSYTVTINGVTAKSGTYNIDGVDSTKTIATGSVNVAKDTSAKDISFKVSFAFNLTWSGVYGGTKSASGTISVPKKTSYTVSYNANGGSGAPGSQTKWFGTTLKLSATKPTRTGYSFQGWGTTSTGTSVNYAAGDNYTTNAGATLYAIWKANTYVVRYNANGGSGAPGNQTKTYGVALKLSTTKPTRTNYNFLGWSTSASATSATYAAGGNYTSNSDITLYAVWQLAYTKPKITGLSVNRGNVDGITLNDEGPVGLVKFNWSTFYSVTSITIAWSANGSTESMTVRASGNSGSVDTMIGDSQYPLNMDVTYSVTISVSDSNGTTTATRALSGRKFIIDALAGGEGISFGKPAELKGYADFGYKARFRDDVHGNAYGLAQLEHIPANSDVDNYTETGCFAITSNANAETIANLPIPYAGRFIVSLSLGQKTSNAGYTYLEQRFIPFRSTLPTYTRSIEKPGTNADYVYGKWTYDLKTYPVPASGTNLNNVTVCGQYPLHNLSTYSYSNCPLTSGTGLLEVMPMGADGQLMQRITHCAKADSRTFERIYHSNSWGEWVCVSDYGGTLLASPGMYMTAGHTATLAEPISKQKTGIVLVFSEYADGEVKNYNFNCHFVPKYTVSAHPGVGYCFNLTNNTLNIFATKYLYINNSTITGHDNNNVTGTGSSGITYTNNRFVLRYVIGV